MRRGLAMVVVSLAAHSATALGQRTWLDSTASSGMSALVALGVFDDNVTTSPVATLALRGRHGIGDGLVITGEVPFAHARQESGLSGSAVGVPWIGLEHGGERMRFEIGARIALWSPSSQESALPYAYGQLLDFDRWEAWFAKTSSVRAAMEAGRLPSTGSFATARVGLTGLVSTGSGGDGELFADYQGRAGIAGGRLMAWVGILGHGVVTTTEGGLGERTLHQVEAGLRTRGGRLQWEASLRRFIGEDFASSLPVVIRVGVTAR